MNVQALKAKQQDGHSSQAQPHVMRKWTVEEDKKLRALVKEFGEGGWVSVSLHFNGRKSNTDCRQRWRLIKSLEVVKGPWSEEEDQKVKELIQKYGTKHWSLIAGHMRTRNEKQCRERWYNHLNQAVVKSKWTPEEDRILLQYQRQHGNRWATIAKLLPGRSDNCVKNRWHSTLKKHVEMKQDSPTETVCPLDQVSIPTKVLIHPPPTQHPPTIMSQSQKPLSGELEGGSRSLKVSGEPPQSLNRKDNIHPFSSLSKNQVAGLHKRESPMLENRNVSRVDQLLHSGAEWSKEVWAVMCGRTEDQLFMTEQARNFMKSFDTAPSADGRVSPDQPVEQSLVIQNVPLSHESAGSQEIW